MSSIPQLDMPSRTYRCSQKLPMSCRYRLDHVYIPASNQKEVQDFLTNCAGEFENSKMEASHHPTMHLINRRRVLKPRYNSGRYATQTQRNDISSRQMQKQYHQTARMPLPPVYEEENQNDENQEYEVQPPNIFLSEFNQNNLISMPQSIRIRMYHRNEMIQPNPNHEEADDQQLNNDAIDNDLPLPPYEEDKENVCEEIDEKDIDKAAEYTESIDLNAENDNNQNSDYVGQNDNSKNAINNDNQNLYNIENPITENENVNQNTSNENEIIEEEEQDETPEIGSQNTNENNENINTDEANNETQNVISDGSNPN